MTPSDISSAGMPALPKPYDGMLRAPGDSGPGIVDGYTADQMHAYGRACMPPWMPIESAPKHKEVLVWREDSGPFIAKLTTPDAVITPEEMEREGLEYPDDFEEWYSDAYGWQEGSEKPTLWQPLPPPPASTIQGATHG